MNKAGAAAIVGGAGVWGLFWIPLRYLNDNGVPGLWAVALSLVVAGLVALPVAYWKDPNLRNNIRWYGLLGTGIGLSAVLYFAAIIFTDVVRVVFLFYLLPVWATLTSWLIYSTSISRQQLLAIPVALFGLFLLLDGNGTLPLPSNLGDWFALAAGFFWGLCLTLLRGNPGLNAYSATAAPFLAGSLIAICFALTLPFFVTEQPGLAALNPTGSEVFLVALLFGVVMLWPSMLGQVWGARLVPSTTAALLTMSEIVLATLSAWYLIGTTLTPLSLLGGCVIIAAAVLDLTGQREAEPKPSVHQ